MLLPTAGRWLRVFANYGPWLYNHLGAQIKPSNHNILSGEARWISDFNRDILKLSYF